MVTVHLKDLKDIVRIETAQGENAVVNAETDTLKVESHIDGRVWLFRWSAVEYVESTNE